jgi:NADPH:quinone reductase-like Zn-dependent oxidoreductase
VAQSLGADRVVTTIDDRVGPFDLVIDGVGGSVLADAVRRLAPGGTATSYGMASGDRTPLAFNDFRGGAGAKLIGFRVYGTDVRTFGQDLAFMAGLIAQGRLRPLSEVQRDWSETLAAVDALRRHEAVGKVILTIGDSA